LAPVRFRLLSSSCDSSSVVTQKIIFILRTLVKANVSPCEHFREAQWHYLQGQKVSQAGTSVSRWQAPPETSCLLHMTWNYSSDHCTLHGKYQALKDNTAMNLCAWKKIRGISWIPRPLSAHQEVFCSFEPVVDKAKVNYSKTLMYCSQIYHFPRPIVQLVWPQNKSYSIQDPHLSFSCI
jgi:hypothetical protein